MGALSISVVSDVICPWCYLGKRRLERALDGLGLRSETPVSWLPFELNPDMPVEGMERQAYRAAKFGAERSTALDQRMTALGLEEGIEFAFERQTRTPNTRRAHALIAVAMETGLGDAVVTALFRGYFEEGLDLGDPMVLTDLASAAGMDPMVLTDLASAAGMDPMVLTDLASAAGMERTAALHAIDAEVRHREVRAFEAEASRLGITSVPFFAVNEAYAISGAQPAEVLMQAFSKIAEVPAS
ncbi:DsbA family oxidoreductase [Microvirga massiliensis]|uniref:DsbA family oxidoreductase n=1 Tax=Microvirga massiliensis TaxID=1033741 RepID=UPI00062B6A78|nr:DsbA family oxidoreductase [Microvirga massiliensis]